MLVVSADAYNRSRIHTVVCAALSSNLRLADAPGNVLLPAGIASLPRASVVNVSQLLTLDKGDLEEHLGRLGAAWLRQVDAGLRQVLALAG